MKTIQLLILLLGAITLSAQEMQHDTMKIPKDKQEITKDEAKKSVDSRFAPKAYQKSDWTRKIPTDGQDYPRGKIRTH
jgi:hypothetical protein